MTRREAERVQMRLQRLGCVAYLEQVAEHGNGWGVRVSHDDMGSRLILDQPHVDRFLKELEARFQLVFDGLSGRADALDAEITRLREASG